MRILLLNGPNLNLLGTRAPDVYGATTLEEVKEMCRARAEAYGHRLYAYQSNHEGALIDAIHNALGTVDAIVFNPGAYTHTSYALRDAIEAVEIPTVEIHVSNVREREPWRRISRTEPACVYQIFGRGVSGYLAAISYLHYRAIHEPTTLSYGTHPDQVVDLRVPDGAGPHPVAVLIHGGGWTAPYTRDTMDGMAVHLAARGLATWNIEYRRVPPVGCWRDTIADVAGGVDSLASFAPRHRLDPDRISMIGHSAGAQLAMLAAKDARLKPRKLVSLSGMLDLRRLGPDFDDLLGRFMGDEVSSHLDKVDPIRALPVGVETVAVHGDRDTDVAPDQSLAFIDAARIGGDKARFVQVPDTDHAGVINPKNPAWEMVADACLGGC